MDNEARRYPLPPGVEAALSVRGAFTVPVDWNALADQLRVAEEGARDIRLVDVAKNIEPDMLDKLDALMGSMSRCAQCLDWSQEIGEVKAWVEKLRSLNEREGMR